MSANKKAFQKTPNGYQNGHGDHDHGQPKPNDDGKMKRIEKENFHLRRQVEEKETATHNFKQIVSTLRTELSDIKDKNLHLEMEMIKLKADGNGRKVNQACRQRVPSALKEKMHKIREKLQCSEKKLEVVKSENIKLKRKHSSEREVFDGIILRKRRKLEEKCTTIRKLESELEKEREKFDVENGKLLSACDKLNTALDQLEKYETKIAEQNGLIEELKCKSNLLEPALQQTQKLQKWCTQAEKLIENFDHANKKDQLEITKLRRFYFKIKGKLKGKQDEVDGILIERNLLFDFVDNVCAISQFPKIGNVPVQKTQLLKLAAHLKKKYVKSKIRHAPIVNRTPVVIQHAEDFTRRKSGSIKGCGFKAKYFCKCGKIETSEWRLNTHIKLFSPDRHFKCLKCPNRFLSFGQLKYHMGSVHLEPHALDKFVIGCKYCGEMFETREMHRQHQISAHIRAHILRNSKSKSDQAP